MVGFIQKMVTWVMLNGATLLGILQSIVKAIKELLTGVVNLLSLFMPSEVAAASVKTVRAILNKVDELIEKAKGALIK